MNPWKSATNSNMSMPLIDQPASRQRDSVNTVRQTSAIFLSRGRGKLKGEPALINAATESRGHTRDKRASRGKRENVKYLADLGRGRKVENQPGNKQTLPVCPILIEFPQILTVPIYFYHCTVLSFGHKLGDGQAKC